MPQRLQLSERSCNSGGSNQHPHLGLGSLPVPERGYPMRTVARLRNRFPVQNRGQLFASPPSELPAYKTYAPHQTCPSEDDTTPEVRHGPWQARGDQNIIYMVEDG